MKSFYTKIIDAATVTSTTQSTSFKLPVADTYSLLIDTGASSGTSPTLDICLQFSPDEGTTWYNAPIRAAQATTGATVQMITFRPHLSNEAAWHNAVATTGGALAKNFVPAYNCRISYVVGGTSASYAVTIYLGTTPHAAGLTGR